MEYLKMLPSKIKANTDSGKDHLFLKQGRREEEIFLLLRQPLDQFSQVMPHAMLSRSIRFAIE